MLRIDIISQDDKGARLRFVEETENSSSKCGELYLSKDSFIKLVESITYTDNYSRYYTFTWPEGKR